MMSLEEKINNDIKEAMKARDPSRLEALRAIKSAILIAKTEKGATDSLSEEVELKLLQRLIKQRKESAQIYKEQDRMDLYTQEQSEAEIIANYLPEQMDEKTLREEIGKIISNLGAASMADMGKVMGVATQEFAGKAEGRLIAEIVRSILSG
jgi:uncharacterized protein YqeY